MKPDKVPIADVQKLKTKRDELFRDFEDHPWRLALATEIKTIDDQTVVVAFACPNGRCPDIIVGDVIEVDGVQGGDLPEQKGWFMAESFDYVSKAPRPR